MIPKVIHYCWFGGKPLPADVAQCIASWKKHCPDYEIRQWDESNFHISGCSFAQAAYQAGAWAFVSDYARLKIIHDQGGIYLDTDVELLKNLDFLLPTDCYLGQQQADQQINTGIGFGAQAGHPVIAAMLRPYETLTFPAENRAAVSCPVLNTQVLSQLGYVYSADCQTVAGATIFPARYFDPVAPGHRELTSPDTVSIHHYSASWTSGPHRWKRKLIRLIGDKWIIRLKGVLR